MLQLSQLQFINNSNQNISSLILEPLDQNKYKHRLNEDQTATPRLTSRQHKKLTTIQSSLENLPIVRNVKEKYGLQGNNELDRMTTLDQQNKIKFEKRNKGGGKNLPPLNDEAGSKIDSQQFEMKMYKHLQPRNSSVNQDLSQYEHLTINPINQNSNINSEEFKISNVKNGSVNGGVGGHQGLQIQHKYSLESLPMINMNRSPLNGNNGNGQGKQINVAQQRHDQSISFMDEKSFMFEDSDNQDWSKNINKKKKLKGAINSQLHQAGGQQQQLPSAIVRQSGVNMSIQEITKQANDQGNKFSFPKI
ncbi:UNKNOWN [Stylonychia lemnae]|uniref:Uncharacterized protein n=1 Tax=Stylonychia lemnae TaxID=5949 RepID=A0A078AZH1_STYLE|nr:UNKNOWN [Stylonychia lemnae]|eukprot:CDW87835.1 UNKNOWN [Stylonychia lemnae]